MTKGLLLTGFLTLTAVCLAPGCAPTTVNVDLDDAQEKQVVSAFAARRVDYQHRLAVLEGFYRKSGSLDKLRWAVREARNLDRSNVVIEWSWLPEMRPPEGESVVDRDERVLVEYTVAAREAYLQAVRDLISFYESTGQTQKLAAVRKMDREFNYVRVYEYFLPAEIPGPELRPVTEDPQAKALYEQAHELHVQGKGLIPGLSTDYEKQEQALLKFRKLVREHPSSTRIALAAYFIAEIYKEYFDENIRAVRWYERAWQWDPQIDKPARFQAATVYDLRLDNAPKAIELYRESIRHDPYRLGNERFARGRIAELSTPAPKR